MNLMRKTITTAIAAFFVAPLITGAAAAPPSDDEFTVDKGLTQQVIESYETVGSAKHGDGKFAHVYLETVDYETRVVKDSKLPKGVEVVVTQGKPGFIQHFVVEDEKIYSVTQEKPQEEVIRKGTRTNNESPAIAPELIERWEQEEAERKELEAKKEAERKERKEKEAQKKVEREQQEASERTVSTDSKENSNSSASSTTSPSSSGLGSKSDGCGGWRHLVEKHFGDEVEKGCSVLKCESQGNPKAQNPYSSASGGWQFIDGTWRSVRSYAGASQHARAMHATPEQQTIAAKRLRDTSGWGQWVCQ